MLVLTNIAISGIELLMALGGIALSVLVVIFFFRNYFSRNSKNEISDTSDFKLSTRAKHEKVDAFKLSSPLFNFGLLCSLGITILAFSWTDYEDTIYIPDGPINEIIDIDVIRTKDFPKPKLPPPPPPVIEEVPEEEIIDEEPEFVDNSIDEDAEVIEPEPVEPKIQEAPPPAPVVIPEPAAEMPEEVVITAEQMPRFPGCEDTAGNHKEKKACADKEMLKFIYKNIKYPALARENGVEGTCVIRFVIDKKGRMKDIELMRGLGAGIGGEALRVVNLMKDMPENWMPGKQRGRPVNVQFNLPIKFKLN